ncbi:MAG: DUF4834 family protein [Dysgonamonadaceae bacterium]|jgi:hypothetical protein|nr:DUF4834 family protein [Dysgonamonadaceae bacterium]
MRFLFIVFLLFVLLVFLFGFSILRMLFGGIFGTRPGNRRQQNKQSQAHSKQNQTNASSASKKIIASDEGEYVDYVEIKD